MTHQVIFNYDGSLTVDSINLLKMDVRLNGQWLQTWSLTHFLRIGVNNT